MRYLLAFLLSVATALGVELSTVPTNTPTVTTKLLGTPGTSGYLYTVSDILALSTNGSIINTSNSTYRFTISSNGPVFTITNRTGINPAAVNYSATNTMAWAVTGVGYAKGETGYTSTNSTLFDLRVTDITGGYWDVLYNPYHDSNTTGLGMELQETFTGGWAISTGYALGTNSTYTSTMRRAWQWGIGGFGQPYIYHHQAEVPHTWDGVGNYDAMYPEFFYCNDSSHTFYVGSLDTYTAPAISFSGYGSDGSGAWTWWDNLDYRVTSTGQWANMSSATPRAQIIAGPSGGMNINGAVAVTGTLTVNGVNVVSSTTSGVTTNYPIPGTPDSLIISNGLIVRIGIAPPYGWEWEAIDFLTRVGIATNDAAGVATNINNLVINAKNHGWWNVCEAIYPMVGGNITNYCEDLRANPGWPITWHNATWSSNGVVFNGTSAYGDTLFNPSSSTPISSIGTNSTHLFAYVYSGTYANGATFIGCQEGSFLYYNLSLYPDPNYATTNIFTYGLFGLANYSPTINTGGDIRGPMMISKNSAVKEIAYCRALTNTTPQQTVVMIYQGLPNCTITVGARNTTTTVASFFNGTIAGATFGASVPHAAAVNMIADWNTFQQKLGRKVP